MTSAVSEGLGTSLRNPISSVFFRMQAMPGTQENVTELLASVSDGSQGAWNKLLAKVYRELHTMAHQAMRKERPGQTLQTTALVHEAYLHLVPDGEAQWENRRHFFGAAARAMRRILVEEARKKKAAKRGRGRRPFSLLPSEQAADTPSALKIPSDDLEALDRALEKLGSDESNARLLAVVELRFFVGMTIEETAKVLDVSTATVKRDWDFTRAWLFKEVDGEEGDSHERVEED